MYVRYLVRLAFPVCVKGDLKSGNDTATERAREKKACSSASFDGLDITRKVLLCPCVVRSLHLKAAKSNQWNAQCFLAGVC